MAGPGASDLRFRILPSTAVPKTSSDCRSATVGLQAYRNNRERCFKTRWLRDASAPHRSVRRHARVKCGCGQDFTHWVTPEDAAEDLVRSALLAFEN